MMAYQWLFFDADDTLFDFPRAEEQALVSTFSEAGLPYNAGVLPIYHQINQQLWHEFEQGLVSSIDLRHIRFERLFSNLNLRAEVDKFSRRYLVHLANGSLLLDGAEAMLQQLAGHFQMGLITNGLPEVQRPRLARSTIAGYFSFVAISEEIGAAKPDPRFFLAALSLANNPNPRSVLVIGDSLNSDIRGGMQSGLDTLWYNPRRQPGDPRWPATYEVDRLSRIPALLATM